MRVLALFNQAGVGKRKRRLVDDMVDGCARSMEGELGIRMHVGIEGKRKWCAMPCCRVNWLSARGVPVRLVMKLAAKLCEQSPASDDAELSLLFCPDSLHHLFAVVGFV